MFVVFDKNLDTNQEKSMCIQPFLNKAAAHSLAHSALCMRYGVVSSLRPDPAVVLYQQSPGAKIISETIRTTLSPFSADSNG